MSSSMTSNVILYANAGIACIDGSNTTFSVTGSTGNTEIYGTLRANGTLTCENTLFANRGITCGTGEFVVENATGNTTIQGNLVIKGSTLMTNVFQLHNNVNSEIVRLNSNGNSYLLGGNFGIGTSTPSAKLHVIGDINITGNYKLNNQLLRESQWVTQDVGPDEDPEIYFQGNVAIGKTSTPAYDLDVNGKVNLASSVTSSVNDVFINNIQFSDVVNSVIPAPIWNTITTFIPISDPNNLDSNGLPIVDASSQSVESDYTYIQRDGDIVINGNTTMSGNLQLTGNLKDANGNVVSFVTPWTLQTENTVTFSHVDSNNTQDALVGIGTTAPSFMLDVNGTLNCKNFLLNGKSVIFPDEDETGGWVSSQGNLYYTGGNIGFNTSTPQDLMDVNGNAIFRENVYVQGDIFDSNNVKLQSTWTLNTLYSNRIDYSGNVYVDGVLNTGKLNVTDNLVISGNVEMEETVTCDGLFTAIDGKIIATPGANTGNDVNGIFVSQFQISANRPANDYGYGDRSQLLFTQHTDLNSPGLNYNLASIIAVDSASGINDPQKGSLIFTTSDYGNTDISQYSNNCYERMRIDTSGNVGINNDSPQATLDINGSMRQNGFTGGLSPTGSIIQYVHNTSSSVTYPPTGWLECDGSIRDRAGYMELFNVVGTGFGSTTNANFILPYIPSIALSNSTNGNYNVVYLIKL